MTARLSDDGCKVLEFDHARWVDHAACAGMAVALFYSARGESAKEAKAVCAACPVRQECIDHAVRIPERHGIWGGLSERERRRMRRSRLPVASAVAS